MSKLGKIAEIPAGTWTKWLMVGFWVVVVAVLYPAVCQRASGI